MKLPAFKAGSFFYIIIFFLILQNLNYFKATSTCSSLTKIVNSLEVEITSLIIIPFPSQTLKNEVVNWNNYVFFVILQVNS
jgi:hypothetical protein